MKKRKRKTKGIRRHDKDNPYRIYEEKGHAYVSFKDGNGEKHTLEISRELYALFDRFELEDISHMNHVSRYIEHSRLSEYTLNRRACNPSTELESRIISLILAEDLPLAISRLSDLQRRRIILSYYADMSDEEIAEREGCSRQAIQESIDAAIENLRKFFMEP